MGAWGIKGLESDAGLDVVDFIQDLYKGKENIILSHLLSKLLEEDFLSNDEIDFLYDNSAMSLAELVIMYDETNIIDYDHEDEKLALSLKKSFTFDSKSLEQIYQYLIDIKNEKPDQDGMREITELWKDSDSFEEWQKHLNSLITKIKALK